MTSTTPLPTNEQPLALICTKRAAKILGVSHRTLEDWRVRGGGPEYRKLGRIVRYHLNDIKAYADSVVCRNTAEARCL